MFEPRWLPEFTRAALLGTTMFGRQCPSQLDQLVLRAQVNTKTSEQPLFALGCVSAPTWGQGCSGSCSPGCRGPGEAWPVPSRHQSCQCNPPAPGAEKAGWAGLGRASPQPHASLQLHRPPKTNGLEETFPLPTAHTREVSVHTVGQELKNEEERKTDRKIHLPL